MNHPFIGPLIQLLSSSYNTEDQLSNLISRPTFVTLTTLLTSLDITLLRYLMSMIDSDGLKTELRGPR